MSLDDLARRAASDVRNEAMSRAPHLDPAAYREQRRHRTNRSGALAASAVTLVVLAVLLVVSPEDEEPVVASTIPHDTTTTENSAPPTILPGELIPPRMILGGGWEEILPGPLAGGRYRMAMAWTGTELFMWGGHRRKSQGAPPPSDFLQDGYLYDPATDSWRYIVAPPELCRLGQARAMWLDGSVLLHGETGGANATGCASAALFDPATNTWHVLRGEFFDVDHIEPRTPPAWTGELLVAPTRGIAYDLSEEQDVVIPVARETAGLSSPVRAHWTGSQVVAIGGGSLRIWAPGDDAWRSAAGPPVSTIARDSVWTGSGLLVVNYSMATAVWDSEQWTRIGDLPLRFFECLPEALVVSGTPVVRMCSGIAIWDDTRETWIPVPLDDVIGYGQSTLVATDDAIYSFGGSDTGTLSARLRRFQVERNEDGSIVVPPTIPIGATQLDVPDGFQFVESFAPVQDPEGFISDDATIGMVFRGPGGECQVSSSYEPRVGIIPVGQVSILRPGRPSIEAYEVLDLSGRSVFAYPDSNGSDVLRVICAVRADAVSILGGVWSPREPLAAASEPSLVVTPQAGGPGTVVTLQANGFGEGWINLTLVSADGTLIRIPTAHMGDSDRGFESPEAFTWGFSVDRYVSAFDPIEIPAGKYEFAVDGRLIEGATFTKIDPPFPYVDLVEVISLENPDNTPIEVVVIDNLDVVPVQLDGWRLLDEISPMAELVIDDITLEPGQAIWVDLVSGACTPGVANPTVEPFRLTFCTEERTVAYDSIALRDAEGRLVDRVMVAPRDDPWVRFYDGEYGVHFELPVDHDLPAGIGKWQIADESLTPPGNPLGVLSVGTYPMRPGGDRCAGFPQFALNDLGSSDALISVQRRADNPDTVTTTRPDALTYEWLDLEAGSGIAECLDRADAQDLYLRFASFVDNGNLYYVLVAVGDAALNTVRAEQVLEILNRLEFDER